MLSRIKDAWDTVHIGAQAINENAELKVLIVEDLESDSALLKRYLADALPDTPMNITVATRLEDALTHLRLHRFDLILTDLKLPDADGLETVEQIKVLDPTATLIVLSGMKNDQWDAMARERGAQDYIIKGSLNAEGIASAIQCAIKRQHQFLSAHHVENCLPSRGSYVGDLECSLNALVGSLEPNSQSVTFGLLQIDGPLAATNAFGHDIGVTLWNAISLRLKATIHDLRCLGRIQDESLLIHLPLARSPFEISRAGQVLIAAMNAPFLIKDYRIGLHAHLGLVHKKLAASHFESESKTLIPLAWDALNQSRNQGRNQMHVIWA